MPNWKCWAFQIPRTCNRLNYVQRVECDSQDTFSADKNTVQDIVMNQEHLDSCMSGHFHVPWWITPQETIVLSEIYKIDFSKLPHNLIHHIFHYCTYRPFVDKSLLLSIATDTVFCERQKK